MKILQANKDKTFVKRILEREKYPRLELGDGNHATHKMAWGEVDKKYRVFPTVLYDGKSLKEYKPDEAFRHTSATGNYIDFDTPQEADWFSRQYKSVWNK
jgi:hypothetical protein